LTASNSFQTKHHIISLTHHQPDLVMPVLKQLNLCPMLFFHKARNLLVDVIQLSSLLLGIL